MKYLLRGLVTLPVLAILIFLFVSPAAAADLRTDDTIIISSGDVIDDDVYLVGNRIIINGTVNGDAVCIGNEITVSGDIDGNLNVAGATIEMEGNVTRSVRVAGRNVTISGEVGGDVVTAGDRIDLTGDAGVGRDLVFAGRTIHVDSAITDGILGMGTDIFLNNTIGSDVEVGVDSLVITSSAVIGGDLIYTSTNEADIQSGAVILGTTTHTTEDPFPNWDWPQIGLWGSVFAFFMTLVTGIVIIAIAPRRAKAVADSIKINTLRSLGWGALVLIFAPVVLVLVFITIIGIPVSLIGVVVYLVAIFLSQVAVGLFIGSWILGNFRSVESRGMLIGAFALGFTLLTLVKLIPFIGWAIWLATTIFGIGAMLMSQRTIRMQKEEVPTLVQ